MTDLLRMFSQLAGGASPAELATLLTAPPAAQSPTAPSAQPQPARAAGPPPAATTFQAVTPSPPPAPAGASADTPAGTCEFPGAITVGDLVYLQTTLHLGRLPPGEVEVSFESAYLKTAVRLTHAGGSLPVPRQEFTPTSEGTAPCTVRVQAENADGVPVARWVCEDLRPKVAAKPSSSVQIVNHGMMGHVNQLPPPPPPPRPTRQELRFIPDPLFTAERAKLRPVRPGSLRAGPAVAGGWARVAVTVGSPRPRVYAVTFGRRAVVGRGGPGNDVDWWVEPVPDNPTAFRAISLRHLTVEIRDGFAFVTDHSSNGTSANGVRLTKNRRTPLRHGDELTLATGGVRFDVRLQAAADGVFAVLLTRQDGLRDRLAYLLVADAYPVELPGDGAAEAAFVAAGGRAECRLRAGGRAWVTAAADRGHDLGGAVRACWAPRPEPQEQQSDVAFPVPN